MCPTGGPPGEKLSGLVQKGIHPLPQVYACGIVVDFHVRGNAGPAAHTVLISRALRQNLGKQLHSTLQQSSEQRLSNLPHNSYGRYRSRYLNFTDTGLPTCDLKSFSRAL